MSDIVAAVDLRESAEDRAFHDEVRTFLEESLSDAAAVRGGGGAAGRAPGARRAPRRGAPPRRPRLDLRRLAQGARRPGPAAAPAGHLPRGVRPGRGPGRLGHIGEGLLGPTLIAFGTPEQQRASCRRSWPARSCGARATPSPTPAPTWPTCRPGPSSTAASGSSTARRCGPRWPTGPTGASCSPAPTADAAQAHGHLVPARARCASPASRSGRSSRSPATASSTRCSSTAPAPRRPTWSARSGDGWKVAMGTLGLRAGRVDPRPAARLRQRARRHPRGRAAQRRRRRPGHAPAAGRRLDRPRDHAAQRPAHAVGRAGTRAAAAMITKLYWATSTGASASWPWTCWAPRDDRRGPRAEPGGDRYDPDRCSGCSCSAGPTRSTPGRTRSSATSSASGPSACPRSPA